ncbi:MAG: T9SS type A sorting domain-containing protein [Flavobacteriales bacterium]|nr:T9SS type A sorting domain-containing protein [Flavobacteriales bacterium]
MKKLLLLFSALFLSHTMYAQCGPGQSEVLIHITPDNYPNEISWKLTDQSNVVIAQGTYIGDTLCIPTSQCVTFTMYDSFGDGICCGYGNGSYSVTLDGILVASGGQYATQDATSFNCAPGTTCGDAIVVDTLSYTAPGNDYWYSFTPPVSGMYLISTCVPTNTCDTKIWVYDHCNNLVWNNTNQGTIYYDDNAGNCGINAQLAQVSAALDPSQTYYIRIGSNNALCGGPIDFFIDYVGPITGCTDPTACNYNPLATVSDGSCLYWPDVNCPAGPDLSVVQSELESSMYWDQVIATNCWVQESCLRGYGTRDIIRFTTHIKNEGAMDYFIGNPTNQPNQFTNTNCHGHWHYEGYAEYVLYKTTGQTVPIGFKNGFCVLDLECSGGGTAQYGCGNMGISHGCGDIYSAGLDCQWIDITDVTPGDYILAVKVNWDQSPDALGRVETDFTNNWAQVCINIYIDAFGHKNFTIDTQCDPYTDCAGVPYGNTQIDCNGVCGGSALMGDLNVDNQQTTNDSQLYVDGILNNTLTAQTCNDLNADGHLSVFDAALMTNCDNHATNYNGLCFFPHGVLNTNQNVYLMIDNVDYTNGYVDISILNPDSKLKAFEFDMSGLTILDVLPLYNTTDFPHNPQFIVGGNKIIGHSTIDSTIPKNVTPVPFVRVYYQTLTGDPICIANIVDMVNSSYEKVPATAIGNCVVGVEEQSFDANNYMLVWPNPANGLINIELKASDHTNGTISITNTLGEVVMTIPASSGNNRYKVDVSGQPNGVYFINYTSEGSTLIKKIVISK